MKSASYCGASARQAAHGQRRGGLVDVAEQLHGEELGEKDEVGVVVLGAAHEELDLAGEVFKAGDGAQQVLHGGDADAARTRSPAHGLGGGLFEGRVLEAGLQADRGGVLRVQPFKHCGETVRFVVLHVLRDDIEHHQPVLELEGERGIPSFAGDHLGHVFLRRHLAGDFGVAGNAAAGEQPLESALTDQLFAGLVKQSADALLARQCGPRRFQRRTVSCRADCGCRMYPVR